MPNKYVNAKKDLSSTSVTTLYTAPALTTGIVKSILVSEDSGNADTITLTITDAESSPATFSLFKTKYSRVINSPFSCRNWRNTKSYGCHS